MTSATQLVSIAITISWEWPSFWLESHEMHIFQSSRLRNWLNCGVVATILACWHVGIALEVRLMVIVGMLEFHWNWNWTVLDSSWCSRHPAQWAVGPHPAWRAQVQQYEKIMISTKFIQVIKQKMISQHGYRCCTKRTFSTSQARWRCSACPAM